MIFTSNEKFISLTLLLGEFERKFFFLSFLNKHHNDSQPTFQFTTDIQEITRRNLNLGEKETFAIHQTCDFFT